MSLQTQFLITLIELSNFYENTFEINQIWNELNKKTLVTKEQFLFLLKNAIKDRQIKYENYKIKVVSKIDLAIKAYMMNPSNIYLFKCLDWHDFELMCERVLELNGYNCKTNYRFKTGQKRGLYEIDIVAYKTSYLLLIDCKKWWMRHKLGALKMAAHKQIHRTQVLSEHLNRDKNMIYNINSNRLYLIPLLITSLNEDIHFYKIPIIPFSYLNKFLEEIDHFRLSDCFYIELTYR